MTSPVHITVTGTGFRAATWTAKCIESVRAQTVAADHIYIAADRDTLDAARAVKPDAVDGIGKSAFDNLIPLWRSLPPEEIVCWLDGDDWLYSAHALEHVKRAHEAGALMTYGQFQWSSNGQEGFAAQHDHSLDRARAPWRATILRTFRAGLVRRIRDDDLTWPPLDDPGASAFYDELHQVALKVHGFDAAAFPDRREAFAGKMLDATLDQAIMLPLLEMCGPDRAKLIKTILAVYNDINYRTLADSARLHETKALIYIRTRRPYQRIDSL